MIPPAFDRAAFAKQIPVSRETLDQLTHYGQMLADWQTRMNLVGPATLPDLWRRHFLDSAQLTLIEPDFADRRWLDIGAGAGFPGLVLAILGAGHVDLVDSTQKKARFLQAVVDELGLAPRVKVHAARAEALEPWPVDIITARAVAPLERLMEWTHRFWTPSVRGLFLKGETAAEELTQARKFWTMTATLHVSLSDPRGRIIDLRARPRHSPRR